MNTSKRKGITPRRKDNDFDRNGRLLIPREGVNITNVERQLFDPRSDHPITFNKSTIKNEELQANTIEKRPSSSPAQSQILRCEAHQQSNNLTFTRRQPVSGRRLWNAEQDVESTYSNTKKEKLKAATTVAARPTVLSANAPPKKPVKKRPPPENAKKEKVLTVSAVPLTEERKRWKLLIASLREIENKLEAVTASSRSLPCFNQDNDQPKQPQRNVLNDSRTEEEPLLVEQDILDAEPIWKEKIQLHLALGDKYLEILRCDLEYAEKKGLESLCWKRAVYSLVDQFRNALKKSTACIHATVPSTSNAPQSELASMLFEKEQDGTDEIPVIHQGGGMTFVKVDKPTPQVKGNDFALRIKQTKMILALFLQYLDLADNFYLQLSLFLKSVDDEIDSEMEIYLNQWRRTKRFKWYNCVPLRGDIARYRWTYTPEEEPQNDNIKEQHDQSDYNDMTTLRETTWTKQEAFEEAWKRYYLGIWLMPAKGNLYFNLSLLLQQQQPQANTQGNEFHKLYLSIRSLMVRRNAFLNARESMLVLFEGNRRWVEKYIEPSTNNGVKFRTKRNKSSIQSDISSSVNKDLAIPALLVRLHGMLFTKIGLDEFSKVKRAFFDMLFKSNHAQPKDRPIAPDAQKSYSCKQLSETHFFWFETIILCLSSLYTYDYTNSKLTKLLSINTTKLFYPDTNGDQQYKCLAEDLGESILFAHEIDLTCQIAVELFQRYLDRLLPLPNVPKLPTLPSIPLDYNSNKEFLFGAVQDQNGKRIHHHYQKKQNDCQMETDDLAWLVYIEILLHWMVLNGICIRTTDTISLWELLVGDIGYDLINQQQGKQFTLSNDHRSSKISPAFWPLLLQFLNRILSELSDEDKYDMVNKHLLDDDDVEDKNNSKFSDAEYAFAKNITSILGLKPDLPEEEQLRGLGWVDEIHGRFLKIELDAKESHPPSSKFDTVTHRKLKILDYGFTLVKHLEDILFYDPVEEIFTISKTAEDRAFALDKVTKASELNSEQQQQSSSDHLSEGEELIVGTTIAEMDDDVLLSCETDLDEQKNEGDDIMTQLKKRREQLQSIVATAEAEERFGYRRLPGRAKEREARLNYLRECIIPGKTILVLDTNCFIGHIDHVKKLLQAQKWSIIVPLVVVTELDGLRTNPQRLGTVAQQGIQLLESALASKPKQSTSLRIQTSHNNFMNDISIRSEQFVFGESDKNLDDLILSSCLWWAAQHGPKYQNEKVVPVCLVTGDRNLSVKARARDVEVVPVSAIIQLTPSINKK